MPAAPRQPTSVARLRDEGEEEQLPGGARGGEDADDEAAVGVEPPVGDDRAEDEGHGAGAGPDEQAPQQPEVPRLRHDRRQAARARDDEQGDGHGAPDPPALHHGGGERCGEPEQHEVQAHRPGGRRAGPAELLLDRLEEDAGGGAEGRRGDEGAEGDGRDDPGRVPPRAGPVSHPGVELLGHRASVALGSACEPLGPSDVRPAGTPRRRRPRGLRRQRRRPGPPGRWAAGAGRLEVGPLPDPARPGARPPGVRRGHGVRRAGGRVAGVLGRPRRLRGLPVGRRGGAARRWRPRTTCGAR